MKFKEFIELTDQQKQEYFEQYKKEWLTTRNSQPPKPRGNQLVISPLATSIISNFIDM